MEGGRNKGTGSEGLGQLEGAVQPSQGPRAHAWPRPAQLRDHGHSVLIRRLLYRAAVRSRSRTQAAVTNAAALLTTRGEARLAHGICSLSDVPRPILTTLGALCSSLLHPRSRCRPRHLNSSEVHQRHIPGYILGVRAGCWQSSRAPLLNRRHASVDAWFMRPAGAQSAKRTSTPHVPAPV